MGIIPLVLLTLYANSSCTQQVPIPRHLPIVDEAVLDPTLKATRDKLLAAARNGDVEEILRHVSSDVQVTYSAERGIARLKRKWNLWRSPAAFLNKLRTVLSLGGRFETPEHDSFVAPSIWLDFPDPGEMGTYRVVIHKRSPVYSRPDGTSQVLLYLDDDVLPANTAFKGYVPGWILVTLPDKREGYMRDSDIRSAAATRAYFTRVRGRWLITGFYDGVD